ncbi:dual specificity protein phosphatase 14-like [Pristis pectinata]|uniref:dual specificity protein phosphatase 14-like n=1 Tax=Pristis pectinata TaxID=685728 RepID=UPI00223D5961|nr:dual specificity protein phosphatase 14-like [Pristis pectinata]
MDQVWRPRPRRLPWRQGVCFKHTPDPTPATTTPSGGQCLKCEWADSSSNKTQTSDTSPPPSVPDQGRLAGSPTHPSALSGMAQITPSLFLSNGTVASDRQALRARGITCVVNATLELGAPRWPDMEYLRVPLPDLPHAPLSLYFDTVADRIQQVSRLGGRTLVHCVAGVSRSPTLCLAYLMKHHGQSLREAHNWVRSRRPLIRPNSGFWRQLIDYERRLFSRNSVRMVPTPLGLLPDIYVQEVRGLVPHWAFR